MSHWATPDTVEKAEFLRGLMSKPLKARFAGKHLGDIAGSDVLFDRIDDVCLSSPYSDVREIVRNWLEQIVFSWQPPSDVVDEDAIEIISEIAGTAHDTDQAVKALVMFGEDDFRQLLSDIGLRHRNDVVWSIAVDEAGYDLFALSNDGAMYRFSLIDGGLLDIHEANKARYMSRFEKAPEIAP
ncbi:hypothetical protein G6L37_35040 [Agrobacterium rubi]|nr:hypothetical protein [Agrobacterium rubi]NTF23786.1 hypothetical protein [Agrobacterium rubi]